MAVSISSLRKGLEAVGRRRLRWMLLIAGLLVAYALRVHRLGDQNIWWDEGLSVWAARKSFVETTLWTAGDVHPPLYFWLLWPWIRLAGESEFAARYITVIEAMLTVALMFPLGRRLAGRAVGTGALWLLTLSRFHVWWSQEMRMYVLAALCITLSTYLLVRAVSSRPSRRTWILWILATAGALYTIYLSVALLILQNLFVLIVGLRRSDRWALWRRWIIAQGALASLYVPWLALAFPRMRSWGAVQPPPTLWFVLELNAVLLSLGISTNIERYRWAAVALAAIVALGVAILLRQRRRAFALSGALPPSQGLTLLLLGVLLTPTMVWLVTQPRSLFYAPMVEARYFLAFAPLFYVLLAWSLAGLLRSRILRPLGLLASLSTLTALLWVLPVHYASRYLRDDLQTLTRLIWTYAQPGDATVLISGDRYPLFLYYYDRAPAPPDRPPVYLLPDLTPTLSAETVDSELEATAKRHTRIWLAQVESHHQDPQNLAEPWLAARCARPLSLHFDHNGLHLFAPQPAEPVISEWNVPPQHMLSLALDPSLEVLGYDLLTQEFRPGDTIRLGLYLQIGQPISLTVRMVGPADVESAYAVLNLSPADGVIRRQVELPVTPYTPAGCHHFELRTESGEAARIGEAWATHTLSPPSLAEISHPMSARVGDHIHFLGYDLSGVKAGDPPTAQPGNLLILDLYWQAEGPIEQSYTTFTHLVGEAFNPATDGPVWAQSDGIPLAGAYPTNRWLPGRPLRDRYELAIASDAPPGDYLIEVGMYLLETGERLSVDGDGADPAARRLLLTPVRIVP